MAVQSKPVMRVEFGDYVLDADARELFRQGRAVAITPKAFELLRLLVENRPRALSKRELFERLWPDVVVVEANLANLVGEVRAALGEDGQHPRFVRTLHRFGYAFRAEAADEPGASRSQPLCRILWKGGRASLREGEHVLGRDPALELYLDSETVSRRHAKLVVRGTQVVVEDLGSKNGTFVGGKRIRAPQPLEDGDQIRLGSVLLKVRLIDRAASTRTRRERD